MTITTEYSIGDRFVVRGDRWELVVTGILIRASGQVEYQMEWVGNADFRNEWMTAERIRLLGLEELEIRRECKRRSGRS